METKNKDNVVIGELDNTKYYQVNRVFHPGGVLVQPSSQGTIKTQSKFALNPMPNGTCRTIKNQYFKNSISNFMSTGTFGATGVIEKRGGTNEK